MTYAMAPAEVSEADFAIRLTVSVGASKLGAADHVFTTQQLMNLIAHVRRDERAFGAKLRRIIHAYDLLEALRNLADDVKGTALNSFNTAEGDFYEAWQAEDPEGFAYWNAAVEAIAKAEAA